MLTVGTLSRWTSITLMPLDSVPLWTSGKAARGAGPAGGRPVLRSTPAVVV